MPEIFSRILLNILPTKIKPNGMLFMSTFHKKEMEVACTVIEDNFIIGNNYCESTAERVLWEGVVLNIDGYSVTFKPTPVLQSKIAIAQEATKELAQDSEVRPAFS